MRDQSRRVLPLAVITATALLGVLDSGCVAVGGGSIILEVPTGFGAQLDAKTGGGRVHVQDVNLAAVTELARNAVRGQLGPGGPIVRLRAGGGSITVRNAS